MVQCTSLEHRHHHLVHADRHAVPDVRNVSSLPKNCHSLLVLLCRGSVLHVCNICFLIEKIWREPIPGLYVCTPHNVPHYIYAFWIPVIVFDCILFALTLCVCIQRVQSIQELNFPRNHMWKVLFVDSLLYFSITAVTYIASGVVWLVLPTCWRNLPQGFSISGTCVIGARLILNLRKAYFVPLTLDLSPDASSFR